MAVTLLSLQSAIQLPQFFFIFFLISVRSIPKGFFGHIFRHYHCRNFFFLSPTSITSLLSPLSLTFFSEFRQWCCRNSLLSSISQISLNSIHITNKLGFLQYSAKRLVLFCLVLFFYSFFILLRERGFLSMTL